MIGGFNFEIEDKEKIYEYYEKGNKIYNYNKKLIKTNLDKYLAPDGTLNAEFIKHDWFPDVECDVFLSHSHLDFELVISLAGWLYEEAGLKSFIDSCVWRYSNDLIRKLDDTYSKISKDKNLYSYQNVLKTSSHVHMILNTALINMINKTDCLMFINTPNSVNIKDEINNEKTLSPWIYSEIFAANIIQENRNRNLLEHSNFSEVAISYKLPIENFADLKFEEIEKLVQSNNGIKGKEFLKKLYNTKNIKEY